MNKKLFLLFTLIFSLSILLIACGGDDNDTSTGDAAKGADETNDEGTQEDGGGGGTLTFAVDQEPEGLYIDGFSGSAIDADIMKFIHDELITTNEQLELIPHVASWETADNKVFKFTIKEGVKWHNDEELTMEDWQFAIEVLAHPDYEGPRFDYVSDIEGAEEFREGKADTVSGFQIVDDYNAIITFKEKKVNNLDNLWINPMPKKHLEHVEVKDMDSASEVRENPIGFGPFKVKEIVPGEYVSLEKFTDYWQGEPKIDEVLIKVIDPSLILGALQNGEIDVMGIRPDDVEDLEATEHINVVEEKGLVYSYIGFRFGHYDNDTRTAVADFDKFKSKELRQALFYALDRQSIVDNYLKGKATIVNTPIPSTHWIVADEAELTNYDFDQSKANELLDQAGFKDVNGDGFREDPDGNEFVIKFGHYEGPAAFEGRSRAIMQAWEDVGIKTELAAGQLIEFNTYNEMKDNDDEVLETFFGSWYVGADPDPTGLWHSTSEWNYGRWVDEKSDALLDDGLSEASFDNEYRKNVYIEWQKHFNEELPGLPLWENVDLYGINERIDHYVIDATGTRDFHEWSVK